MYENIRFNFNLDLNTVITMELIYLFILYIYAVLCDDVARNTHK